MKRFVLVNVIKTVQYFVGVAAPYAAIRAIDAYGRVYDDFLDVRFDSLCFCGRMGYGVIWVRLEYRDVARRVARHN